MAAKKIETSTSKFYVGHGKDSGNVKIQYPSGERNRAKVQAILDAHPRGKGRLRGVSVALGKIGAAFVPWADGAPGYEHAYR